MVNLLSVRDLQVSFYTDNGVAHVLDRVRLDIAPGEVMGLVGESGCGKTTLARTILGILPSPAGRVHGGHVEFQGEDLLRMDPATLNDLIRGRAVTFIPQDPYSAFNPVFSVGTQIMELMKWKSPLLREGHGVDIDDGQAGAKNAAKGQPARNGGKVAYAAPRLFRRYPKERYLADRQTVLDLLRTVQIPDPEEALRKYPHEFSGGQRQRLMIAMALLPQPRLIIADEPTTALDVTIQAQILQLLRGLVKERNISVLFTTHDLGTAHEICDKIMVMYAGQEVEHAPTYNFFNRPAHPYTNMLLESLPNPEGNIKDIAGEIPALIDPPGGCRFHPRCGFADARCAEARPELTEVEPGHWVRCFHPVEPAGK